MAKKNESSDLALMEPPQTQLATANDFGGGVQVEGRDDTGPSLSRVAMFQGTVEEETKYGQHKRGVFLDVLEIRELGMEINIMPLSAKATYARWVKGEKQPVEKWDNKKDVPPSLLAWNGDQKPEVQETINVVCIVQGVADDVATTEPFPYLFQFKSTGLAAWNNQIGPLESRRGLTGKPPGLYRLSSKDDKNGAGQPFKRITARPVGDCPADVLALGKKVYAAKQRMDAQATELADDGDFNPDAH